MEHGKLDTNWKGPYIVGAIASKGEYFLRTMEGECLALPRNVVHLKFFNR